MKHLLLLSAVLLLAVSCRPPKTEQPDPMASFLQPVQTIPLSDNSTLQLFRSADSLNFITLCLLQSDGTVDECMTLGNANYCTSATGEIVLDTVSFHAGIPAYILRTYDISSTYGAETWYVLSPLYDFDPTGFFRIDRLPLDMLSLPTQPDGLSRIIAYSDPQHSDSTLYTFSHGLLTPAKL